jgi:putative sigma-54 modulation protein
MIVTRGGKSYMKINYVQRNYKVSDKFKDILEKKLEKLERYFVNEIDIKVNCEEQNKVQKLEITVNADKFTFRGEVKSDNMYNNIDQVLPKLEKQIIKNAMNII